MKLIKFRVLICFAYSVLITLGGGFRGAGGNASFAHFERSKNRGENESNKETKTREEKRGLNADGLLNEIVVKYSKPAPMPLRCRVWPGWTD